MSKIEQDIMEIFDITEEELKEAQETYEHWAAFNDMVQMLKGGSWNQETSSNTTTK